MHHMATIFAEKMLPVATKGKRTLLDTWRLLNTRVHYPSNTIFTGCNISLLDGKLKFHKQANVALLVLSLWFHIQMLTKNECSVW